MRIFAFNARWFSFYPYSLSVQYPFWYVIEIITRLRKDRTCIFPRPTIGPQLNRGGTAAELRLNRAWIEVEQWLKRGWTAVEPLLDRCWTAVEPRLNRGWPKVGLQLDRCWTAAGSRLDQGWTAVEPRLEGDWTMVKPRLNPGWTEVELRLDRGWTALDHGYTEVSTWLSRCSGCVEPQLYRGMDHRLNRNWPSVCGIELHSNRGWIMVCCTIWLKLVVWIVAERS